MGPIDNGHSAAPADALKTISLRQIRTDFIDRPDLPSAGAGETPIIAIAPAIGNAVFDAVGVRKRSLPMT